MEGVTRLDEVYAIERFARLTVPAFADCCLIDLVEDDSGLRRLRAVCGDPATQAPKTRASSVRVDRMTASGRAVSATVSTTCTDPERPPSAVVPASGFD